jgi:hypothetical protein
MVLFGPLDHLIEDGDDIRAVPELLGHSNVATTMIYAQVRNRGGRGGRGPLDRAGVRRGAVPSVRAPRGGRQPEDDEAPLPLGLSRCKLGTLSARRMT